jgi:hypothetical protein
LEKLEGDKTFQDTLVRSTTHTVTTLSWLLSFVISQCNLSLGVAMAAINLGRPIKISRRQGSEVPLTGIAVPVTYTSTHGRIQ